MFVGDEVQLEVSFALARERLRQLAEVGALLGASEDAYDHGTTGLERVGVPGLSKLVQVQVRELASAGERVTILALAGAYRPPLGAMVAVLDRAIPHRVASATIRAFLAQVARRITGQPAASGAGTGPPPEGTSLP